MRTLLFLSLSLLSQINRVSAGQTHTHTHRHTLQAQEGEEVVVIDKGHMRAFTLVNDLDGPVRATVAYNFTEV